MDNRRIYKKRPRQNVFSRVVSLFKRGSHGSAAPKTPPRAFPGQNDPNSVLSEFFKQKGNTPLLKVEYEGVMALLGDSRSTSGSPAPAATPAGAPGLAAPDGAAAGPGASAATSSTTSSTPAPGAVAAAPAASGAPAPSFTMPGSFITTPRKEYKPVSHTLSTGSVKRVYQFSGLPSPYRTKITAPVIKKPAKKYTKSANTLVSMIDNSLESFSNPYNKYRKANASLINATLAWSDDSVTTPEGPGGSGPETELPGEPEEKTEEKKDIQPRSAPVEAPQKPAFSFSAKPAPAPAATEPVFSFGPSKEPSEPSEKLSEKPSEPSEKPSEKPAFSFGNPSDKPAFSFGKPSEPAFSFGDKAPKTFTFGESQKSETNKAFSSEKAPVSTAKPAFSLEKAPTAASSLGETPTFSFGAKSGSNEPTRKSVAPSEPLEPPVEPRDTFIFPLVTPVAVNLDASQVAQFRNQFSF